MHNSTGNPVLGGQDFASREAAWTSLLDRLPGKVPLIIINEFPYLCHSNATLPSILSATAFGRTRLNEIAQHNGIPDLSYFGEHEIVYIAAYRTCFSLK